MLEYLLILLIIVAVAYVIITQFMPEPLRKIGLLILGAIVLIYLVVLLFGVLPPFPVYRR